jgi:hypothetical protein
MDDTCHLSGPTPDPASTGKYLANPNDAVNVAVQPFVNNACPAPTPPPRSSGAATMSGSVVFAVAALAASAAM